MTGRVINSLPPGDPNGERLMGLLYGIYAAGIVAVTSPIWLAALRS